MDSANPFDCATIGRKDTVSEEPVFMLFFPHRAVKRVVEGAGANRVGQRG